MLERLLGGGLELGEAFATLCSRYQLRRCEGGYAMHPRDREVLLEVCRQAPKHVVQCPLSHGWLMAVQDRDDEAASAYREALAIQRGLKAWTPVFPAIEIGVALAAGDVAAAAAALSTREAKPPTRDRDHLLLGALRLAQGDMAGAAMPFRQVVQRARPALATCARNTRAARRLVVALCGLVAAGENHDVSSEIDRFPSTTDSPGPVMELCHQLRMLHRHDRAGTTTPALERCSALLSRPASSNGPHTTP